MVGSWSHMAKVPEWQPVCRLYGEFRGHRVTEYRPDLADSRGRQWSWRACVDTLVGAGIA